MTTEAEPVITVECVNCTQSCTLTNGNESSSSSFKLTIQNNDNEGGMDENGPKEQEVSYDVALKKVFHLQHLEKLGDTCTNTTHSDQNINPASSSSTSPNEKLCLCSDCSPVFSQLYQTYSEFVSHQKSNSILHNKIAILDRGLSLAFSNEEKNNKPQVNDIETQTEVKTTVDNTTNTTTIDSETTNGLLLSSADINQDNTTTFVNAKLDSDSDLIEAAIEQEHNDDGEETQEIDTTTITAPPSLINPPLRHGNILITNKKNEMMAKYSLESPNLKAIVKIEPESPLPLISEICESDIDIDVEGDTEPENDPHHPEITQEDGLIMGGEEEEEEEEEGESVNLSTVSVGSRAMSPDFTAMTGCRKVKSTQKVKPKPGKNSTVSTTASSNNSNNNNTTTTASNPAIIEKKRRRANSNSSTLNNNNMNNNNVGEIKTGGRRNKIVKPNPTPAPKINTTNKNNANNANLIENSNEIKPRPRGRPKKQLPILDSSLPTSSSQQGRKKTPLPVSGEKVKKRATSENNNNNNNRKSVTTEVKTKVSTRVSIKKQQQQEQLQKIVNARKRNPKSTTVSTVPTVEPTMKTPMKRKSKARDVVVPINTITTLAIAAPTTTITEKKRRSKRNKVTGKTVDWDKNKTVCSICNSSFTNAFICFRHEFLMHAMAEQRPPYACEKCDTVFKWKEKYFRHRHGLSGCGLEIADLSSTSASELNVVELQDAPTQTLAIEPAPVISEENEGALVPVPILAVCTLISTENETSPLADVPDAPASKVDDDISAPSLNLLGNDDEIEKTGGKRKRRLSAPDDELTTPQVKSSRRRTLSYI